MRSSIGYKISPIWDIVKLVKLGGGVNFYVFILRISNLYDMVARRLVYVSRNLEVYGSIPGVSNIKQWNFCYIKEFPLSWIYLGFPLYSFVWTDRQTHRQTDRQTKISSRVYWKQASRHNLKVAEPRGKNKIGTFYLKGFSICYTYTHKHKVYTVVIAAGRGNL